MKCGCEECLKEKETMKILKAAAENDGGEGWRRRLAASSVA